MPRFVRPLLVMALVAAGCGQSTSSPPASNPSANAASTGIPDPLVGRWRQDYSCEDLVAMLRREARPDEFRKDVTGLIGEMEGVTKFPPLSDPCAGAPPSFERMVKFANGNVVFFDPPHLQDNGLHANYRVVDDHTFVVNDTMGNVEPSPLTCTFTIEGNTLTIRVRSNELYTLAGFQAAPWVRID